LLPLLAGLAMSLSSEGREALASWWARPTGWRILLNSLLFAAAGATAGLLAGWIVALLVPPRGATRTVLLALCCLPLLVPSSLMAAGWIMALGRDAVITNVLRGVLGDVVPTIYAWPLAASATGLRYFGVAALVIAVARPDRETSAAAKRVFRLPWHARARLGVGATLTPALVAWLLLVLLVQSDHVMPGLFLVYTFGNEVLVQYNALMDPAGAAALALVPAMVALIIAIACGALWNAREDARDADAAVAIGTSLASSRWKLFATVMVLLIAIGIPLSGLVARAGNLTNLRHAGRDAAPELSHGFVLASLGSVTTIALAIPLAHGWLAARRDRRASPAPLTLLNLAVPGSVLALGVIAMPVASRTLLDTDAGLVFAYAARFAAVATVVMFAGWLRASRSSEVAAHLHRVTAFHRVLRLTLPARFPAAVAAGALVALLIIAELEISLLLVRPGPTTLGVRLYTLIHTAPDNLVAALALDILILVTLAALALAALTRAARRRFAWAG